jgi:2-keto-4-pentenoate hydratase
MDPAVVEALRAQLARRDAALARGATHVGWKLAFGIRAIERATDGAPLLGFLTTATQLEPGGSFAVGGIGDGLRAETELVVEVDLPVARGCSAEEAEAAIASVGVGLELVDVHRDQDDLHAVLEGNVLHLAFALGPTVPYRPGLLPLAAELAVDGEVADRGERAASLGEVVRAAADALALAGAALAPGDRIYSGSLAHVPARPGDAVVAAVAGIGSVPLRLVA